jgi:hypothetical protein
MSSSCFWVSRLTLAAGGWLISRRLLELVRRTLHLLTLEPILHLVVRTIRIDEIGPRIDPELSGSILRHLGVDVAFREALIVDRVDVARAKSCRPNLTPIAVRRVAFAEDMDVPRRTRRIGLTVEDLVIVGYTVHIERSGRPSTEPGAQY